MVEFESWQPATTSSKSYKPKAPKILVIPDNLKAKEGDTHLTLKELAPVRLVKNKFYNDPSKVIHNYSNNRYHEIEAVCESYNWNREM